MKKNTQTKLVKKGFSMIELLFVMGIIGALAAIAIPNLEKSGDSATFTALKSDARNFINTVQTEILLNNNELPHVPSLALSNGSKFGTTTLKLTKDVEITMTDQTANCTNGYSISVDTTDEGYGGKNVVYDSCTDSAPKAGI